MDPQQQLNQILQQQLRDVHLPDPISWWPLAISWWILFGVIAVGLFFSIRAFRQNRARNAYRHHARKQLQSHYQQWQSDTNTSQYLQSANMVLKRTSLHLNNTARQLSGTPWIEYLQSLADDSFSEQTMLALGQGIYHKSPEYDVDQIHRELAQWLNKHKPSPIVPTKEVKYA